MGDPPWLRPAVLELPRPGRFSLTRDGFLLSHQRTKKMEDGYSWLRLLNDAFDSLKLMVIFNNSE
jgi:hypothetical protein